MGKSFSEVMAGCLPEDYPKPANAMEGLAYLFKAYIGGEVPPAPLPDWLEPKLDRICAALENPLNVNATLTAETLAELQAILDAALATAIQNLLDGLFDGVLDVNVTGGTIEVTGTVTIDGGEVDVNITAESIADLVTALTATFPDLADAIATALAEVTLMVDLGDATVMVEITNIGDLVGALIEAINASEDIDINISDASISALVDALADAVLTVELADGTTVAIDPESFQPLLDAIYDLQEKDTVSLANKCLYVDGEPRKDLCPVLCVLTNLTTGKSTTVFGVIDPATGLRTLIEGEVISSKPQPKSLTFDLFNANLNGDNTAYAFKQAEIQKCIDDVAGAGYFDGISGLNVCLKACTSGVKVPDGDGWKEIYLGISPDYPLYTADGNLTAPDANGNDVPVVNTQGCITLIENGKPTDLDAGGDMPYGDCSGDSCTQLELLETMEILVNSGSAVSIRVCGWCNPSDIQTKVTETK